MLLSIVDATEQHRREMAQNLLFGELRHRMKNVFGVAQSLARHTTTEGRSAEEYRDAFLGRFAALIEAEDLAFDESQASGVEELLERVLAPYSLGKAAIVIEPCALVVLGPGTVMSLSLVLHEMAKNAAKYGALSVAGGQLRISWLVEDDGRTLKLQWAESGGPPVTKPATTGYGTTLIQSTTAYNLHGKLELNYAADGLKAEIVIPLGSAAPAG